MQHCNAKVTVSMPRFENGFKVISEFKIYPNKSSNNCKPILRLPLLVTSMQQDCKDDDFFCSWRTIDK